MSALTSPCHECPFRRKSLRGYTGPYDSAALMAEIPMADRHFPCHTRITQLTMGGSTPEEAIEEASPCAGACAMMSNTAKLSRDPGMAAAQKVVGKRSDVFSSAAEMAAYHDDAPPPSS